ncbi:hypothetical protein AJ80_07833 [Polytolypa hystricis UAMH7299]|uniref:Major facilitator superfamily (MFS) profile domain-containing protein n=1 Tax=Polytolypa hystricis (strain UAMH7299) TaxID=1447883 RepID=A0A2B7XIB5_POLH7|nr:hypothetical protein AJ80_07833 [Polytolypa hystricis UAMH7299]
MLSSTFHSVRGRALRFIQHPPTIVFVYVLAVLLELEESVQKAPTIRLLENAICNKHYQHDLPSGQIDESMCKIEPIQVRLAHIRGLLSAFDSLPIILFGSVFGSNADRNGRRLAFALAVLGTICAMVWIYFTCGTLYHRFYLQSPLISHTPRLLPLTSLLTK